MFRVLFVTTKIGFGHARVSNTLANAFRSYFSDCDTKITTYFDFFPSRFEKLINTIYVYGLRWFPRFFVYIYLTQKYYKGKGIDFWSRFLGRKYSQLIKTYNPNLIIITQGLACQWLGRLKQNKLINVPLVAVITDFIAHPFWICSGVDFYIVATDDMKKDLISRSIGANKIAVLGIPVDTKFSVSYNKMQIINKLGLDVKNKKILIMGGGWGLGGIEKVLSSIDKMNNSLDLLVVTGKNRSLYRKLHKKKFNMSVYVYGRVDNIRELMAVSDIVVTKAGGVTVSELLASGLPSILWDIIPGQEDVNANYLVDNEAGIRVNNVGEMIDAIKKLVLDDNLRNEMSLKSRQLGKPNSAMDAVRFIEKIIYCPKINAANSMLNNRKLNNNKGVFSDSIEYFGYRLYAVLSRILSLRFGYMLADLVGYVLFKTMTDETNERAFIMQNIHNGKISLDEAFGLVRKSMQLFNRDLVDFFRSKRLTKDNIDYFVKIENLEYLDNAIKNNRGVVCVSAHIGNWEMAGITMALKDYPLIGVVWDMGNRLVAKMFFDIRSNMGVGTVKSSSVKEILELLKKNRILGIMLDIHGGNKGISDTIWGYDVKLPRGPVVISKKTGAEVLICIMLRNQLGGYTLRFEKPEMTGTEEEVTIRMFDIMKRYIELNPTQWHWIKYFFEPKPHIANIQSV